MSAYCCHWRPKIKVHCPQYYQDIPHLLGHCPIVLCSVSELAERYVKQFSNGFDWENTTVIQQLYSLTLGTVATPGKRTNSSSQV